MMRWDLCVNEQAASISATKDQAGIVKKRFIVSLSFADTRLLHDTLFPLQHMDWNNIKDLITQPSPDDWLTLLALIDFVNEQPNRQVVSELIASVLAGIKISTQGAVVVLIIIIIIIIIIFIIIIIIIMI